MADALSLIVPVNLQAKIITQPVVNQGHFSGAVSNYSNLLQSMKSPSPEPFSRVDKIKNGVHLHWALPYALTSGKNKVLFDVEKEKNLSAFSESGNIQAMQKIFSDSGYPLSDNSSASCYSTGSWFVQDHKNNSRFIVSSDEDRFTVRDADITFPEVPNRWLVIRFQHGSTMTAPVSWIIESDYINPGDGTSPYLDPSADELTENAVTKIGKSTILSAEWKETGKDKELYLQAVGPGDISFAAYAPGVENVFCFVDDMKTGPGGEGIVPDDTELSYMVVGWFSNVKYDPLSGISKENISPLLENLGWSVCDNDSTIKKIVQGEMDVPLQSYYHGAVYSVKWQTRYAPTGDDTAVPQDISGNVSVAVGNTAVEALAAMLQRKAGADVIDTTLFEAFNYGVLNSVDEPGGDVILADKIREAQYGTSDGGTLWYIAPGQSEENSLPDSVDLSPYDASLSALNTQQQILDEQKKKLVSLQWELYSRWWKNKNISITGGPVNQPDNWDTIVNDLNPGSGNYKSLINEINTAYKNISAAIQQIPSAKDENAINQYAKNALKLPESLLLKSRNAPRFWSPADPVVLATGLGDILSVSPDKLTCRLSVQVVSGLTVKGHTVTGVDSAKFIPGTVENPGVPGVIQKLCTELYFLNPENTANLSRDAFRGAVSSQDISDAVKSGSFSDKSSYPPDPISFLLWKQAWKPLYLEWSINWYPTFVKDDKGNWTFDRKHWVFDGCDYQWTGDNITSEKLQYQGKAILSPHSVLNFEKRVLDYTAAYQEADPALVHLDELLKKIKAWGVLSQRLSGFHEMLLTRNIEQSFPPDRETAGLVGTQYHVTPFPDYSDQDSFGTVTPYFFPQLAGFFGITGLSVLDSFGQRIDLLESNGNKSGPAGFVPIRSKQVQGNPQVSVKEFSPSQLMQQSLGILQPARLDMRWVDADNSSKEVGLSAGANPVCGWLLPNHLENGLSVFAPGGELLGELYAGEESSTPARWTAAPDSMSPIEDPSKILNLYLRNVVTKLLAVDQKDNLPITNFMSVIDETLWVIDPLGGRSDQNLSVLIGRPLAVVRLKLKVVLEGNIYCSQGWGDTFKQNDGGLLSVPYDVKLGSAAIRQDGLLGYYQNDACDIFNSVHYPEEFTPGDTPYIRLIGKDGNYLSLYPNGKEIFVTLILDPRGSVHAGTGILPVKDIVLPDRFINDAMKKMELVFRVESLLTDPGRIVIPKITEQHGTWNWINHTDIEEYTVEQVNYSGSMAELSSDSFMIRDGWLRLLQPEKQNKK